MYFIRPGAIYVLISKYNGVFYGRDVPYFVCTYSASAGDRHRNQAYLVPGHPDDVGGFPRVGCFHYTLVWLTTFNIIQCCRGFACSTENPFLVLKCVWGLSVVLDIYLPTDRIVTSRNVKCPINHFLFFSLVIRFFFIHHGNRHRYREYSDGTGSISRNIT